MRTAALSGCFLPHKKLEAFKWRYWIRLRLSKALDAHSKQHWKRKPHVPGRYWLWCSCAESIAALATSCCVGCNWCLQNANVFTDVYRINGLFGANLYHGIVRHSMKFLSCDPTVVAEFLLGTSGYCHDQGQISDLQLNCWPSQNLAMPSTFGCNLVQGQN